VLPQIVKNAMAAMMAAGSCADSQAEKRSVARIVTNVPDLQVQNVGIA
jgi:hypothetical protein